MAENEKNVSTQSESAASVQIPVYAGIQTALTKPIICDMCGHTNPPHTSICIMCSNYLREI